MKSNRFSVTRVSALLVASVLFRGRALAEKPEWAGGGKAQKYEQKHEQKEKAHKNEGAKREIQVGSYFVGQQRVAVRDYYAGQAQVGRCPPGLAKKNNGCMPPGQARKWMVGQPLPGDVVFYPVPQAVVIRLGVPPPGYRYVRVASDILLIALGTSMVIDAIQDLGAL